MTRSRSLRLGCDDEAHPLRRALKQERRDEPFFRLTYPQYVRTLMSVLAELALMKQWTGPMVGWSRFVGGTVEQVSIGARTSQEVVKCGRWASLEIVA